MAAEKVGVSGDIAISQSFESHFLTHGLVPLVFEQNLHAPDRKCPALQTFSLQCMQ
jgi:hypothetical protein